MFEVISRRVGAQLNVRQLTFSCYRIRRKWSLALPVVALPELDVQVRGFAQPYPWQIWCLWALEERLHAFAGAVHFSGDQAALAKCVEDLEALAQWPRYTVAGKLGLPYGHAVQLMATALLHWRGLPEGTLHLLREALHRAVDEALPLLPAVPAVPGALLSMPNLHQHLHNIVLITQAALGTAAEAVGHPERQELSARFLYLMQARLALFHSGLTEGISYDGYLHNFALAWLKTQPGEVVQAVVHHPAMLDLENQALGLACPGNVALSAEIGDVEALDMPFVWSALARLQQFAYSASRAALLAAVPTERLRADALWALSDSAGAENSGSPPLALPTVAGIQQSTFALTLATGLDHDDLSCVVALCSSPMNHVQADNGTVLIGHAGHWWITDPGYQQYLKTSEREFTLGPAAHNTPVINGHGHAYKAGCLLYKGECLPEGQRSGAYAVLDLTACYPAEAGAESVIRTLWRLGRDRVVVCDTVVSPEASVAYSWHADADAYWGEQADAIYLTLGDSQRTLWIQSGHQALSLAQQQRLRGSRGQCTLQVLQPPNLIYHWWSFGFSDSVPVFEVNGSTACIDNVNLDLSALLPIIPQHPSIELAIQSDHLLVILRTGDEPLALPSNDMWNMSMVVNGAVIYETQSRGRKCLLPIPLIDTDDTVVVMASLFDNKTKEKLNLEPLNYVVSPNEIKAMRNVPLRVFAEFNDNCVIGRCCLMPSTLMGELEYAFYLLVNGKKTEVRWYEESAMHTFLLQPTDIGKTIQIRGFVRSKTAPDHKISAASLVVSINAN